MSNTKKAPSFFTGFYVSWEMDIMLRGYALMHNLPVSHVLRSITHKWVTDESMTQETIIKGLAHKMCLDWDVLQFDKSQNVSKDSFKETWSFKLANLPPNVINAVIKSFTDETDKQSTTECASEEESK